MPSVRRLLLPALLTGGCFAGGFSHHFWKPGGDSGGDGVTSPDFLSSQQRISSAPWEAPDSAWSAVWKTAESAAERELLLAAWKEQNPQRLLHFLRGMPPLSLPGQRRLEEEALMAWGAKEPVPAFEFACRHHGEYQAADRLLREWLDRDLDTGLSLLTHHLLPESIMPGDPEELSWVLKDPGKVCAKLVTMRNALPPTELIDPFARDDTIGVSSNDQRRAFIKAAFHVWAGSDLPAATAFLTSLHGADAGAALNGACQVMSIPEAAKLLETFPRPEPVQLAAPELAQRWAETDFSAALKWSVENLPPAAGNDCLGRLGIELRHGLPVEDAALRQSLGDFPWWAWQRMIEPGLHNQELKLPLRLLSLAPNDETLRNLAKALRYREDHSAEWLTRVPPDLAERIRQLFPSPE